MGIVRKLLGRVRDKLADAPAGASADVPGDWNDVVRQRPQTSAECTVRFANLDAEVRVPRKTALLDAAKAAGVDLNNYCGGMCSCGSCRLVILSGDLSPMDRMEEVTLDVVREGDADRLGCQALVLGDVAVDVPDQQF